MVGWMIHTSQTAISFFVSRRIMQLANVEHTHTHTHSIQNAELQYGCEPGLYCSLYKQGWNMEVFFRSGTQPLKISSHTFILPLSHLSHTVHISLHQEPHICPELSVRYLAAGKHSPAWLSTTKLFRNTNDFLWKLRKGKIIHTYTLCPCIDVNYSKLQQTTVNYSRL